MKQMQENIKRRINVEVQISVPMIPEMFAILSSRRNMDKKLIGRIQEQLKKLKKGVEE